jgi:hypothetical protein
VIQRAACLVVELEHLEGKFARAATIDELLAYGTTAKTLNRLLTSLGLRRRPKDVTPDLAHYLVEQSQQPPIDGIDGTPLDLDAPFRLVGSPPASFFRRAARGWSMPSHVLMVSPAPRKSGGVLPGKFDAWLGERLIVEASRICDGARALLAQGLAAPGDLLIMRHVGSEHDALRAAVGVAAELTVDETSGNGTPRFVRWKPMPRRTVSSLALCPWSQ